MDSISFSIFVILSNDEFIIILELENLSSISINYSRINMKCVLCSETLRINHNFLTYFMFKIYKTWKYNSCLHSLTVVWGKIVIISKRNIFSKNSNCKHYSVMLIKPTVVVCSALHKCLKNSKQIINWRFYCIK